MVLLRGVWIGTLYKLFGSTISDGFNYTIVHENTIDIIPNLLVEKTMLWHQRMRHIGENGLHALNNKGMVESTPKCSIDFDCCEHYIYGKQNQVRFPSISTRAT